MKAYNYYESVKEDVEMYIRENIVLSEYEDREELEEKLNEMLWVEDSVTGNASGSYTFNREQAKEYVFDNMDLLSGACEQFCISNEEIGKRFFGEEFEYFDVTIRCYLLPEVISDVLDEIEDEKYAEFMEDMEKRVNQITEDFYKYFKED